MSSITAYDNAIAELTEFPDSLEFQHRAVLALARAGSLDFAWAEYKRYGLDKVTTLQDAKLLEDIMALGGRLLKDLFLLSSGNEASDYAKQSSEKYNAAFNVTGGFYSGINAVTMGLIGGSSDAVITERAQNILQKLPLSSELDKETLYYIEATRAEAFLILRETFYARKYLLVAIQHDPRNYTAHATTLRQFKMILQHRADDMAWLTPFTPPKPVHFAGHLFKTENKANEGTVSLTVQEELIVQICDAIQIHDIGAGYGSLAAGSDILIAEALLSEGCDLHITLPVELEIFVKHSVAPYGKDWVARFNKCWEAADSRDITSQSSFWPQHEIDHFSSNITMSKAILQANHFSVDALQLLIWDRKKDDKGTAQCAKDWVKTGRQQIVLPYPSPRAVKSLSETPENIIIQATLFNKDNNTGFTSPNTLTVIKKAFELQNGNGNNICIGLHMGIGYKDKVSTETAQYLAENAVPGGVLASDAIVSFLLLNDIDEFAIDYLGQLKGPKGDVRTFALKHKNSLLHAPL